MFIVVIAKIKLYYSRKLVNKLQWMYWCSEKEAVFVYYYIQHYKNTKCDNYDINITEFIITGYSN